jgi:hypothetical protein
MYGLMDLPVSPTQTFAVTGDTVYTYEFYAQFFFYGSKHVNVLYQNVDGLALL